MGSAKNDLEIFFSKDEWAKGLSTCFQLVQEYSGDEHLDFWKF